MKDWKWLRNPKALLWIIGALGLSDLGRFANAILLISRLIELGLKAKAAR
jgi:hypothetical protein